MPVDIPVVVAAGVRSSARSAWWRARRVEAWSGCGAGGGGDGSDMAAGIEVARKGGGVSSRGGEEDVDMGSRWEA